MKILITGGAGFIGSSIVRKLANSNNEVLVLDALTYAANIDSIIDLIKNNMIRFEKIDICNRKSLEEIFNFFKPLVLQSPLFITWSCILFFSSFINGSTTIVSKYLLYLV